MEFTDYFWSEEDYRQVFARSGLKLIEVHSPLGYAYEQHQWKDEMTCSPFSIFIATK